MVGGRQMSSVLGVRNLDIVEDGASERRWFVVKSLPRKEVLADDHLRRQNFQTFLPLMTSSASTVRGIGTARQSAFFPGYLFVRLISRLIAGDR